MGMAVATQLNLKNTLAICLSQFSYLEGVCQMDMESNSPRVSASTFSRTGIYATSRMKIHAENLLREQNMC